MTAVDITPEKDGGVLKEIIREGTGEPLPIAGIEVTVHYTGTFIDGTKFDSSRDSKEPIVFKLGQDRVIKGFDLGVATMTKGEIAMLTLSPKYAYGREDYRNIPADSTLKFEIELIDWVGEDLSDCDSGGIERIQIKPGKGLSSPIDQALVNIHLIGIYDGKIFDNRDVQFCLGEGEAEDVVEGIEVALYHFKKGEESKLKIKSKYAFKEEGRLLKFGVPPNADVEYIVTLKSFEKGIDIWSMDEPECLEQAKLTKDKATNYFKAGSYNLSIKMHKRVVDLLPYKVYLQKKFEAERNILRLASNLNLAWLYLRTSQPLEAIDACSEALRVDPNNEKAFYRKGLAYIKLAAPEVALKDFEKVLQIEPKNVAASKHILICNKLIKNHLQKEKKLYGNMFEKFAREDRQKEEEKLRQQPDVMRGALGEWGQEERPGGRDATAFEKENPNILMLNANGTGEFQNM